MKFCIYRNPDGTEWTTVQVNNDKPDQKDVWDHPMELVYEFETDDPFYDDVDNGVELRIAKIASTAFQMGWWRAEDHADLTPMDITQETMNKPGPSLDEMKGRLGLRKGAETPTLDSLKDRLGLGRKHK